MTRRPLADEVALDDRAGQLAGDADAGQARQAFERGGVALQPVDLQAHGIGLFLHLQQLVHGS